MLHWHDTYWYRKQKYQSVKGKLLWFATLPLYLTAKNVMLPFEIVSDSVHRYIEDKRKAEFQRQQQRKERIQVDNEQEISNQETLENAEMFKQRLEEIKNNNQIIVVFTQIAHTTHQNPKGYLIIAPVTSCPQQFYISLTKSFKIKQTQHISFVHKSLICAQTISATTQLGSIPLNEKGFIQLEIVRMEAMG